MQNKGMCRFVLFFSFIVILQRWFFAEAVCLKNYICLKNGDNGFWKGNIKSIQGGFIKNGFIKNGFIKNGFIKNGFIKNGFIKNRFIKYGFMNTAGPKGLFRIGDHNRVKIFYKNQGKQMSTKQIFKVRKINGMFLQNSQKEFDDHISDSLNENGQYGKFIEKWKNKLLSNRFRIIMKNIFLGSVCIISFSFLYNFFLNKKMELIVHNVFKDKLFCIKTFQKGNRIMCFLSYSEFRASPFFLSTIVIASYTFYIFVKVYIEKYKEAKRIKDAIQKYNKKKEQYINTGIDEDENEDEDEHKEGEIERNREIKKREEEMLDAGSSEENITNDLDSFDSFYENDELDNQQNMF